jgi:hypothetical protein
MRDVAAFILMDIVFPLWVLAGFADWATHKRTGIAITSGLKESLLHWLMYAEIGAGMLAVAFLEINAAVLAIVLAVFAVHEATVYWDLHYSSLKRDIGPFEQMVHSFLELLPLVSLALLTLMADRTDWSLRMKSEPWPLEYLAIAGAAALLFNALPLAQETWSCLTATRRTRRSPAPR